MSDLDTAIQLIRQGNVARAQKYLEVIVRTEPQNVPAWLWYAQTWPSDEARLKVLVACMKFNPGDEKILQAIKFIRGKISAPPKPPVVTPPSPVTPQNSFAQPANESIEIPPIFMQIQAEQGQVDEVQSSGPKSAFNWDELEQNQAPAPSSVAYQAQPAESKSAFNWDEIDPEPSPSRPITATQTQGMGSKSAFNWDEIEQTPAPVAQASAADAYFTEQPEPTVSEVKAPGRSFKFYEAWWTALTNQKVEAYAELLDDPHAGIGRALEWQIYTNLILLSIGGLVGYFQFQSVSQLPNFQKLQQQSPMFANFMAPSMILVFLLVFIVIGLIFGVLGLLIGGAFQNFLARMFGGTGNFSRTVYALSAYLVPMSIVATVMGYIPLVQCATIALSGYSLVLNVRALQAAQGLNGGRATIIVAIPSILLLIVACIGFIVISPWINKALPYHY